jgi:SAM-dependent MidA family methyltransferase
MENLTSLMIQRIQHHPQQRIPFAEYMSSVLYDPEYGYYTSGKNLFGKSGDFRSSPHLSADFAELIAQQALEMWQTLDKPNPFFWVEMGAGTGVFARDFLAYSQTLDSQYWQSLRYILTEKSPALIAVQQTELFLYESQYPGKVQWLTLEDLSPITGCFFSNELVDAFPVHRVGFHDGVLQEIYVTVNGKDSPQFTEEWGEVSDPRLQTYFEWVGVPFSGSTYPEGYCTEVNLAALQWITEVAEKLVRGYVLTIDYGYSADQYYTPLRKHGTLLCYYKHTTNADPYQNLGSQDITAHVDFTALQKQGESLGLMTMGITHQSFFLSALGLVNRLQALQETDPKDMGDALQHRNALHLLVDPLGLGNFWVLLQAKGLGSPPPLLQGLRTPG